MNRKRCFVLSLGLALVGCSSAVETDTEVSTTAAPSSSESAAVTLVTLNLPGMT